MDDETKIFIEKKIQNEINRLEQPPKKSFFKSKLFDFIAILISFSALLVSYLSYKESHPNVIYSFVLNLEKNLSEYDDIIERYFNLRDYDPTEFKIFAKIKNKNPKAQSRLDTISGSININIWRYNRNTLKIEKIGDELFVIYNSPFTIVCEDKQFKRPIIKDMIEGYIYYQVPKDSLRSGQCLFQFPNSRLPGVAWISGL